MVQPPPSSTASLPNASPWTGAGVIGIVVGLAVGLVAGLVVGLAVGLGGWGAPAIVRVCKGWLITRVTGHWTGHQAKGASKLCTVRGIGDLLITRTITSILN